MQPRHEATNLNARIRKAFIKNKTPIYSIGNAGDLTYDYKIIEKIQMTLKKLLIMKVKYLQKYH